MIYESCIYLIDDNEAVCHAIKFLFDSFLNQKIIMYHNPLLFLDEFSAHCRGCLIIDMDMPAMNGIDLIKHVKNINPCIPVIMISGHGTTDTAAQSKAAGAVAFITKPFKTEDLLSAVKTILPTNV